MTISCEHSMKRIAFYAIGKRLRATSKHEVQVVQTPNGTSPPFALFITQSGDKSDGVAFAPSTQTIGSFLSRWDGK